MIGLHEAIVKNKTGIPVCAAWIVSSDAFWASVGPQPMPGLTILRNDESNGYGPDNVRWGLHGKGVGKCMHEVPNEGWYMRAELCERHGLSYNVVCGRLHMGMDIERALTQPAKHRGPKAYLEWEGNRVSIGELSRTLGMKKDVLAVRLKRGWSLIEAMIGRRIK